VNQQPIVIGCYLSSNEIIAKLPAMEVGSSGPGCLTSEDEERETWTAESLRVSVIENFGFQALRLDERLRRYTF